MPSPALLLTRAQAAITQGDPAAFARWTRHPRWDAALAGRSEALLTAVLGAADPIGWLERVRALGLDPTGATLRLPLLHQAASQGRVDVVEWLLEQGARPVAACDYGMGATAADMALLAGHAGVVGVLWRATGSLRALMGAAHPKSWLQDGTVPALEHLASLGWSVHAEDPGDPAGESFLDLARRLAPPSAPVLRSWVEAQALAGSLPAPADTNRASPPRM